LLYCPKAKKISARSRIRDEFDFTTPEATRYNLSWNPTTKDIRPENAIPVMFKHD
jgi:hypothetical protein